MPETLEGVIERVTFHNLDTGFAVLRVQAGGRRGLVTVVGTLPSVTAGEYVTATGDWQQDRDHGLEFRAAEVRTTPPHTAEGIAKYLGSGLVKGIGPEFAKRIVAAFGPRTLQVIDESPSFLSEVKGIGTKRIARIRQSWADQKAVRSIMVFLQSHGVGTARAVRIYKTYGDKAVDHVRENPYRLATDIWGVGFRTADELAGKLGVPRDSPLRALAGVRFALQEQTSRGHVGFPEEELVAFAADELLRGEIGRDAIAAAVEAGREAGEFVRDRAPDGTPRVYLKPMFLAELGLARAVHALREGEHPLRGRDPAEAVARVERAMGLELAPSQRHAIAAAGREKVLVVTGGPGTGKSTITRGIVDLFASANLKVGLCAPTGRAAKRLAEATGREARTVHRLLEYDPGLGGFKRDRDNPLDLDLLVVDEASMADVALAHSLLRAVPPWACVVIVGDVDQLPSVGPGTVLADLIRSDAVPVVRLTQVFRQAGASWIVRAAHAINAGDEPESAPAGGAGDFYFVEADAPEAIIDRVVAMLTDRIPKRFGLDPLRDVQVLSPMNRTELGVRNLNARLQAVLNPPGDRKPEVQRFGFAYRVGDKVLQTQNNYQREVYNGDLGRVAEVSAVDQEVTVEFDGRPVVYDFGELDELVPAYATSIHRSQGSEYPAVVIPLHTQHYMMLQRNLLYTAVTRGRKLVVVVGSRKALALAVRNQDTARRHTLLAERLRVLAGGGPAG